MSRILLIGLDGAEPSLLLRWMEEGRLPHLARLAETGCFSGLRSTDPAATFPAWTSCVTGMNPGRHGLFDFTEMKQGSYALRFVNSTYRKAPALWNILSDAGKRVAVLGVPGTYPPEAVNGIMVSGFDSPVATSIDKSFVYPESRYPDVAKWRFADFQESHIGSGWHETAHDRLLSKIEDKTVIACRLLEEEPWDFFMMVFSESDTVAHHFWRYHDPDSPRHATGLEHAIRTVYQRLDTAVGKLCATAGEDVTVMVVSDHGFGGAGTGVVHLNNWLAEQGYLRFSGHRDSLLKCTALKFTPERWRGPLFRKFQGLAERAESASRFGGIDWEQTTAWSEELNYFPSIRVNLQGRDAKGQVTPETYDAFVAELCGKLETWEPIARAMPRAECYDGPYVEGAPDIILDLALEEGYSHSCLRSRGGPAFRRMTPDEYAGGKEKGMNGAHRPEGILLCSEACETSAPQIMDIAPTVLSLLEVPAPPMDGTSLLMKPLSGKLSSNVSSELEAQPYTEAEEQLIEDRLRKLGYLE